MGHGGFNTPGSGDLFAHTIANDGPHALNAAFNINRFVSGDLVDNTAAAVASMFIINCPFCGERDQSEFSAGVKHI